MEVETSIAAAIFTKLHSNGRKKSIGGDYLQHLVFWRELLVSGLWQQRKS